MLQNLCIYRVAPENADAFKKVLPKHHPALVAAGLSSQEPPFQYWMGKSGRHEGKVYFIEFMHWKDASGPDLAHQMPEVMAVWEPMGKLTGNDMDFVDVEPLKI